VSLLLHQALLIVAGLWLVMAVGGHGGHVSLVTSADAESDELQPDLLETISLIPVADPVAVDASAVSLRVEDVALSAPTVPGRPDPRELAASSANAMELPRSQDLGKESRPAKPAKPSPGSGDRPAPRMAEAGTVEGALDGVLGEIRRRAAEQDLLVVWLLDASLSLLEDRQRIAARLSEFFGQQDAKASPGDHLFLNAVVAYGKNTLEMETSTRFGKRVVTAALQVPTDVTGVENVFGAVKWAASRYHKRSKGHVMMVVWTDESGDDVNELESAIELCRKHKVSVSVVGPSSVLGRIRGIQTWIAPATRQVFSLPVHRGPDTPVPERLRLPYWFDTRFPSWGESVEAGVGPWPAWYGGPQLEGLVAGIAPWGLVRLTRETGGTYTLLDRPADRSPFRVDVMRPYLPSYDSAAEYLDEIRYHPLRRAVVTAVECTSLQEDWRPPAFAFMAVLSRNGNAIPVYHTPASFRSALKDAVRQQQSSLRPCLFVIGKALSAFGPEGMEGQYDQEPSPRWRAWYDLTRGRLLAALVRYREYDALCGLLQQPAALAPTTNHIVLVSASNLRSGPESQAYGIEAQRLLSRCLAQNPYTPWAYLAQRELDHPLGIDILQNTLAPPPPTPVPPPRPVVTPPKL